MTTLDGAVDLARDRELVERCQAGSESSFAELYDRYHRRLLRFCLRRLHSYDDAEEAAQEAFTRAWRALPSFGGDRRFYPWLTVIAGNVCTDILRRRARVVPMDEVPNRATESDGEELDARLLTEAELAMATEALGHLSDRHQRVLRLRESTEWSAQRIAELEGVAVPAVDTLLWRARQALKREYAVLSDAGGLAGILGIGVVALRRAVGRLWLRVAGHVPAQARGPGTIAATLALTGAAIAGGGVALVGSGPAPHVLTRLSATTSSSSTPRSGGIGSPGSSRDGASAGGLGATSRSDGAATDGPPPTTGGARSALPGRTGATGLGGVLSGGTATAQRAQAATTSFGGLFSHIGGVVDGEALPPAPGSTGAAAPTAATATAATATIGDAAGSAAGSVTGPSGTPASGVGSLGTAVQQLTTPTTVPATLPPAGDVYGSARRQ